MSIIIPYLIAIPIVAVVVFFVLKGRREAAAKIDSVLTDVEENPLQITPSMQQALEKHAVLNVSELRQMNSGELSEFLSFSADVISMFEERLGLIADLYGEVDELQEEARPKGVSAALSGVNFNPNYKSPVERLNITKRRLETQYEQAILALSKPGVENVLGVIPEKYRMSLILNQFCEYLSDGEADSWEGCIKVFKEDVFRLQQREDFQEIIANLETISANTPNIAINTRMAAFFAGITAWNTRG
ncbi:MAG: hypothetical protein FWD16_02270 [Clostridia bacterium]|nr:hypothetical protein [Clostridia bacterium]